MKATEDIKTVSNWFRLYMILSHKYKNSSIGLLKLTSKN